jgi:hypothetical protein
MNAFNCGLISISLALASCASNPQMGQDLPVPDDDFTPSVELNSTRMPASEGAATKRTTPQSEPLLEEPDRPKHRGDTAY